MEWEETPYLYDTFRLAHRILQPCDNIVHPVGRRRPYIKQILSLLKALHAQFPPGNPSNFLDATHIYCATVQLLSSRFDVC